MSIRPELNSFDNLLSELDLNSNNPTRNEKILDKFFLKGEYADHKNYPIGNYLPSASDLAKQKSILAGIPNKQKIDLFTMLLRKNFISADYYQTQIQHYQRLKVWCKHSIFTTLAGDYSEQINKVEELPLPTLLKQFLKDESTSVADKPINSPSP